MRKVLFKKWIPAEYPADLVNGYKSLLPNTNCFEADFTHEGVSHQWANAYEEFETGAGNYTVALVETSDGRIEEVVPLNLKFINSD